MEDDLARLTLLCCRGLLELLGNLTELIVRVLLKLGRALWARVRRQKIHKNSNQKRKKKYYGKPTAK